MQGFIVDTLRGILVPAEIVAQTSELRLGVDTDVVVVRRLGPDYGSHKVVLPSEFHSTEADAAAQLQAVRAARQAFWQRKADALAA